MLHISYHVFWWRPYHWLGKFQRIRTTSLLPLKSAHGFPLCRRETPAYATPRDFLGTRPWFHQLPIFRRGDLLGKRQTGWEIATSYPIFSLLRKAATRCSLQDIWIGQLLWTSRIGNGGLHAIKLRQYEQTSALTSAIRDCFSLLQTVLRTQPKRQFPIVQLFQRRFCAASDAALEEPRCGTGGFLLLWFDSGRERREAFYSIIPDALYDLWTPGDKKIAQLELVQVLFALASRANSFRHRRGLWFIDNLAALMALVRGRSDSPDLERLSHLIHLACFALKTWIYWEYIPSKSNWADAISRLGFADPWHQHHGFTQHYAYFPTIIWNLPLPAITLVFEYLWSALGLVPWVVAGGEGSPTWNQVMTWFVENQVVSWVWQDELSDTICSSSTPKHYPVSRRRHWEPQTVESEEKRCVAASSKGGPL